MARHREPLKSNKPPPVDAAIVSQIEIGGRGRGTTEAQRSEYMNCRAHYLLTALLLTGVLDACAADTETNSSAGGGSASSRGERTSVEQAFRKALGRLKGRVNLLDRNAHYLVSRADAESWHIQLKAARDVRGGDLLLIVKDSGTVALKLSQTNAADETEAPATLPQQGLDAHRRQQQLFNP